MERPHDNVLCRNFCTYFAVVVIILMLGRNFQCTCKPQASDCNFYLTLPFCILFVFILWTDRNFQRVCKHLCSSACGGSNRLHTCSFFGSLVPHVVQAAMIGLLWVIYVFLDGNWYVCCLNNHSAQQAQLACKSDGSLTDEERVLVAELKNKSRVSVRLFTLCSDVWGHNHFRYPSFSSLEPFCSLVSSLYPPCCPHLGGRGLRVTTEKLCITNWFWSKKKTYWRRFWGNQQEKSWLQRWRAKYSKNSGNSVLMLLNHWLKRPLYQEFLNEHEGTRLKSVNPVFSDGCNFN